MGVCPPNSFNFSWVAPPLTCNGVQMGPGATPFTRMPVGASCLANELPAKFFTSKIARQCHRFSACFLDQRGHFIGVGLLGRKIVDRHISAFARVSNGSGAAHSRVAAGDEGLSA